jgi:hypothetical protein
MMTAARGAAWIAPTNTPLRGVGQGDFFGKINKLRSEVLPQSEARLARF